METQKKVFIRDQEHPLSTGWMSMAVSNSKFLVCYDCILTKEESDVNLGRVPALLFRRREWPRS